MQVLQLLNVVEAKVSCISGSVAKDGDGTDEDAFTAGAVRYIDPDHLRPFTTARGAAQRLCRANGTRFLSGYAIADDRLDEVLRGLDSIAVTVSDVTTALVTDFDQLCMQWEQKNPQIMPWKSKFPCADRVRHQCGMQVSVYKINPQQLPVFSAMEDGILQEVQGMPLQIIREIAKDVSDSWIPTGGRATQRIKGLLTRVRTKLRSLEFLGGDLQGIAQVVEDVLARLPSAGPIEGPDYMLLSGLLLSLSDPARMVQDLAGMAAGLTVDDIWAPEPTSFVLPQDDAATATQASESMLFSDPLEAFDSAPELAQASAPFAPEVPIVQTATAPVATPTTVPAPVFHTPVPGILTPTAAPVVVPPTATAMEEDAWAW